MYEWVGVDDTREALLLSKHVKLVIDVLLKVLVLKRRLSTRAQLWTRAVWDSCAVTIAVVVKVRVFENGSVASTRTDRCMGDGVTHIHASVAQVRVVSGPVLHIVDSILEIHGSATPTFGSRGVLPDTAFAFPGLFPGI